MTIRKASGFALIDLIFVCGIMGLLTSVAVPSLLGAKQAASAASAVGTLRAIASSELTYALTCGSGFYAPNLVTLGTPPGGSTEPYISPDMGAANMVQKSSYTFRLEGVPYPGAPPSCNGLGSGETAQGYRAGADPTEPTNLRFFAVNAGAQIYENSETLYGDMPEVGESLAGDVIR